VATSLYFLEPTRDDTQREGEALTQAKSPQIPEPPACLSGEYAWPSGNRPARRAACAPD
jgi:hypothetical protein